MLYLLIGDLHMINILNDDLKYKSKFGNNYGQYQDGYRIVFFYSDNTYEIETFCGNIEGFMADFVEVEPVDDESDIPPFVSIDDILDRYLNLYDDISGVAIYKTDGTCISKKSRNNLKNK